MPHTTTPSRYARYLGPHTPPTIDPTLLTELADAAREENKACARKVAHAARIWETCIEQTVHIGERITDAGNYASSETAAALGCSKTVADTYSDIGMDLRLRLPHIKAAFDAGDLDLPRVRAIHRVTGPYSTPAVEHAQTDILTAALHLSPGPLATEINATMHRCAPDEAAQLRTDLTRLTTVKYRDKDMIATIEADLEAADAAASWQRINEVADTLCPRDPRTRGQRRAAAYTALMRSETHIACTCEPDDDHPCTANPEPPDRRRPLTTVTIDIDTLLRLADLPAYLADHGTIDADYARQLAHNSDLQILITEALDLAHELGHIANPNPNPDAARDTDPEPTRTPRPTAHPTFHPLGRGRRRRGLDLPTPPAPHPSRTPTDTDTDTPAGQYEGRYTLIAALESAMKTNPALAVPLYPDGHGGLTTPPPGALTYRPGTALADLVRHRDRTCRHPGCDVPAAGCEIDHVIAFDHCNPTRGGWTILTNLHCLCRYHHSLKTMGAWTPTMLAGAAEHWQSNSGTTAVTLPGNTYGTTDLAAQSLIPHIPRKRRPTTTNKAHTTTHPTHTRPTNDTDDPAPF
ncbi:hypothetical protein CH304_15870 [Rhodococcus sp. 15-649-1-2]|nr:HNH endonuclease signature motif containing protein [Rhodococcus sp. 15-649-1-2]OZE80715.1 hypothetical protein CH304_15870 [Rhodococcus sp. 15-649-1-2]